MAKSVRVSPRQVFMIFAATAVGLTLLLLLARPSFAANHYVRAGATGNGSGGDWMNACTDFTGACAVAGLVRGDVYYVASGTYAGRVFDTAVSGTALITVKGATASDHGTDSGWSPAYGVDARQAHFSWAGTNAVSIRTSYFVFDGNTGSGSDPTAYGFTIDRPTNCLTRQDPYLFVGILSPTITTTHVTVKHVAVVGCDATVNDITANAFQACGSPGNCTNLTFANNYSEKTVKFLQASSMANSLIEHNFVKSVGANYSAHSEIISSNNCHSEDGGNCAGHTTQCVRGHCADNVTVRYNVFGGVYGNSITGGIVGLDGNVYALRDWKIYGNVFIACNGGNGCITVGSGGLVLENTLIYNNTFVSDANTGNDLVQNSQRSTDCLASIKAPTFTNNLVYGSAAGFRECPGGPAITHDSNTYLNIVGSPPPGGTHVQTGSTNPFVAFSATCCAGDYRLVNGTAVSPGVALPSPYSTDMDGSVRGADGVWDRGAFEYAAGADTIPPAPPENLARSPAGD